MRLKKACPHYEDCKVSNEVLTDFWGYNCPGHIKKNYEDCTYYEEHEDAIRDSQRVAGQHPG